MTFSIIGIDISKLKFDLCLLRKNGKLKHKVFANNAALNWVVADADLAG
jgi:transposase